MLLAAEKLPGLISSGLALTETFSSALQTPYCEHVSATKNSVPYLRLTLCLWKGPFLLSLGVRAVHSVPTTPLVLPLR